jgi:hypothetical protein
MLPGLEHMLVNLTDAADRARCSAFGPTDCSGVEATFEEIHKGPRFGGRCALGQENSPQIEWRKAPPQPACQRSQISDR